MKKIIKIALFGFLSLGFFNYVSAGIMPVGPFINSISPTVGPAGTMLTITGTDFFPTGNTVNLGSTVISDLSASLTATKNVSSIMLVVPKSLIKNQCFAAPCNTILPVTVTNEFGTSNVINFTYTDTPTIDTGCSNGEKYSLTTGKACDPVIIKTCPTGYTGIYPNCVPVVNSPISLISPQSGSTFSPGQDVTVYWNKGQNTSGYVSIQVTKLMSNGIGNFIKEMKVLNDGSETIHIPNNTPEGQYRIYYYDSNSTNTGNASFVLVNIKQSDVVNPNKNDNQDCSATKFTRSLRYGTRSSQVDALQTILIDKGYLDEIYATGLFAGRTRSAIKLLQSANGLRGDGYVGSFTRALLNTLWKTQCIADQDNSTN